MSELAIRCLKNLETYTDASITQSDAVKQCRLTIGVCELLERMLPGRMFVVAIPSFRVEMPLGKTRALIVKTYKLELQAAESEVEMADLIASSVMSDQSLYMYVPVLPGGYVEGTSKVDWRKARARYVASSGTLIADPNDTRLRGESSIEEVPTFNDPALGEINLEGIFDGTRPTPLTNDDEKFWKEFAESSATKGDAGPLESAPRIGFMKDFG